MADANAAPLAAWLTEWADTDGRPIHVVGYSLGARVTCEALGRLADAGRTDAVASVSLLGGAIPNDTVGQDARYGEAIGAVDGPVTNFHNADDRVLGWIYRLSDSTQAVGQSGIADAAAAPAGYRDVDVTDSVPDHYSYFQPQQGCLPQLVDRLP
jgi:esterase/lipase superfamily enzyme